MGWGGAVIQASRQSEQSFVELDSNNSLCRKSSHKMGPGTCNASPLQSGRPKDHSVRIPADFTIFANFASSLRT